MIKLFKSLNQDTFDERSSERGRHSATAIEASARSPHTDWSGRESSNQKLIMPKDISNRRGGSEKNRYQAYKHTSRCGKVIEEDVPESSSAKRDWEDATCPICMEFPHNAVLLFCSSHDKGCRPYMCNTSYRHSNCLDQYQKAQLEAQREDVSREPLPESVHGVESLSRIRNIDSVRTGRRSGRSTVRNTEAASAEGFVTDSVRTHRSSGRNAVVTVTAVEAAGAEGFEAEAGLVRRENPTFDLQGDVEGLLCPLCRGKVEGWKVIQSAREHLNHKVRSCAQEACPFLGTYEELRVHARREHPFARPSEVDPDRQRDWRRLERRRDLGDVMSTMMPGATVMGDFVIEDGLDEEQEGMDFPGDDGHWWTVFLLFQVFGPATSVANENASRMRSRLRVPRRGLWGETLARRENMQVDGSSEDSDSAEPSRRSTRRRRR